MCCFAGPVEDVNSTKIFARLSGRRTQYVAYQMSFRSKERNAMILPVPVKQTAREDSLKFVDLSKYENLFDRLGRAFPRPPTDGIARSKSVSNEIPPPEAAPLEVHRVGSFEASFVPSMKDFKRLDPRFVISEQVWSKIPEYHDYSFAVFQLKELSGEVHPMAFEFETRLPDTIFFPTVHIHDGQVHAKEHFDHVLYCQHAAYDEAAGSEYTRRVDRKTGLVRSKGKASRWINVQQAKGLVDGDLLIHRRTMRGNYSNKDVWLAARGAASGSISSLSLPSMSMASVGWPLAWIIERRDTIARK